MSDNYGIREEVREMWDRINAVISGYSGFNKEVYAALEELADKVEALEQRLDKKENSAISSGGEDTP